MQILFRFLGLVVEGQLYHPEPIIDNIGNEVALYFVVFLASDKMSVPVLPHFI